MVVGYGHPGAGPVRRTEAPRVVAAALLVVMALVAVAGSFAPIIVTSWFGGPSGTPGFTQTTTGWRITFDGQNLPDDVAKLVGSPALAGIPLTVGALMAVAAAVLLLHSVGRGEPVGARLLGAASASLVVGTAAAVGVVRTTALANNLGWATRRSSTQGCRSGRSPSGQAPGCSSARLSSLPSPSDCC